MLRQKERVDVTSPSAALRTFISLVIVIHLFCVGVVLSSNFAPSQLQESLVAILGPYTKTLHLDPNFVPYHLTSGEPTDRFHQWIVQGDGFALRFPDRQWRGGFPRNRLTMMAQVAAYYAENEMDEVPAELARGFARYAIHGRQRPGSDERLVVRCLRYIGDDDPAGVQDSLVSPGIHVVYEADVWVDQNGTLSVLKRSPAAEVAPPVPTSSADQD